MRVYEALAQAVEGMNDGRCAGTMEEKIENIMKGAPSGSGIDSGTQFLPEKSSREKLVFAVSFHHMNEVGFYDGWTEHLVIVTHDLFGLNIRITGRNRNNIKEYLSDVYYHWIMQDIDWITGKYID